MSETQHILYPRIDKKELSFTGIPLSSKRHKIHRYPAMLHPNLVDSLIDEYAQEGDTVFDPCCGSGVTLLQSSLKQHTSIGCDINPLALLIAKVKTINYDIAVLETEFEAIAQAILSIAHTDIPDIHNIDYWYIPAVIEDLGKIRYVLQHNTYLYKDFFVVCFAYICRHQSLTRNGEFKRYRISENSIEKKEYNAIKMFLKHTKDSIETYKQLSYKLVESTPLLQNMENPMSKDTTVSYDLVITSPPYGDSLTTVAYGQYSSFGMDWTYDLNSFGNIKYKVDKESLGKKETIITELEACKVLHDTVECIKHSNQKRADDVLYFYNGYYKVLKNVVANLSHNGKVCFVVGNRTVKGIQIPMDQITADMLVSLGLSFEAIYVREILNKVMPSKNSPTNKAGQTKNTMLNEYIVVCNK